MSRPTASSRPRPAAAVADPSDASEPRKGNGHCPICRAPTEIEFRPFCSRRCADVDLSRWLTGAYAIPGDVDTDEDGDDSQAVADAGRVVSPPDDDDDDRRR